MSQNFAPYQDVAPDVERSLSPPAAKSPSPRPQPHSNIGTRALASPTSPSVPSYQNNSDYFNSGNGWPSAQTDGDNENDGAPNSRGGNFWSSRSGIDLYETSLGLRLDWEACLAYLALPPAGPVVLLIFEHRSDYVRYAYHDRAKAVASKLLRKPVLTIHRFHAWQSALLFSVLFIVHIIFSWSRILSWIIFAGDLCLIGLLTFRAYKDGLSDQNLFHQPDECANALNSGNSGSLRTSSIWTTGKLYPRR